jgi:hypothetical protein
MTGKQANTTKHKLETSKATQHKHDRQASLHMMASKQKQS